MRIIAGLYRSRRIQPPAGLHTRPTPEKVREAVFSMLMGDIPGATVLDIFAGSGAMGLEALSRGAARCVLIDNDPAAQKAIAENMRTLSTGESARLVAMDFRNALASLRKGGSHFDIVFMDPPYEQAGDFARAAMTLLHEYGLLAGKALLCVEHEGDFAPPAAFAVVKDRRYGRSHISIVQEETDA